MSKRKRRKEPAAANVVAGIAWYAPDQWAKLKQVAVDAETLDDSYEEWRHQAENLEHQLRGKGIVTRRVPMDIDLLVAWCKSHDKPNDGTSRVEYTLEYVRNVAP
jgi:hypothetical protein